jgi:hypothetical protein
MYGENCVNRHEEEEETPWTVINEPVQVSPSIIDLSKILPWVYKY